MKKLLYILLFVPIAFFGQSFLSIEQNSPLELYQGWNMFGYSCYEPIDVATAFTSIEDKIVIVKDNSGNVYVPEFGFNGIGSLERNRGYQIKLTEAITNFQFCPFIVPLVEGCIDETAFNYNSSANMDDGSCYPVVLGCLDPSAFNYNDYDNDGFSNEITGTNGVDVNTSYGFCLPVVNGCIDVNADNYSTSANTDNGSCIYFGCVDIEACNYDTEANTDDNSCEYPNPGYDCFGNDLENCYYPDSLSVIWLSDSLPSLMNGPCLKINEASNYNFLRIENSNLDSIPWLQYFTNLYELEIYSMVNLTSLPDLSGMVNLDRLRIGDNPTLTSLPELSELTNLTSLYIGYNYSLTGLPDLSGLINLSYCGLLYNYMLEGPISFDGLTNLSSLWISGNHNLFCVDAYVDSYVNENWPPICPSHDVGDLAKGGIVFYVNETGQHGLVAAMEDLEGYYEWGCFGTAISGADGQAIGTGYQNTIDIVNQGCSTENGGITAAQAALDAEINGYFDWYLPSIDELVEMYNTIGNQGLEGNIGGFETSVTPIYWSSSDYGTEYGSSIAWYLSSNPIHFGLTGAYNKYNTFRVRVIRAF